MEASSFCIKSIAKFENFFRKDGWNTYYNIKFSKNFGREEKEFRQQLNIRLHELKYWYNSKIGTQKLQQKPQKIKLICHKTAKQIWKEINAIYEKLEKKFAVFIEKVENLPSANKNPSLNI